MHVRKVTVILVSLVSIFITVVNADMHSTKRIPGPKHDFQQMVRYGRSSNSDGKIHVYPRADVFYMGPRYGKRSRPTSPKLDTFNGKTCTYTGVSNLYRCNTSRSTLRENRRK